MRRAEARRVTWRRIDGSGTESLHLHPIFRRPYFDGIVETSFDGVPARIRYRIACDEGWRPRAARIRSRLADAKSDHTLFVDEAGAWYWDGPPPREDLRGCTDLDLSITPATNTIPLRRLGLRVGDSAEIRVAWVRFPQLTVERARQRYTRLAQDRYRYEGLDSGYATEIVVDEDGLVVSYPGAWVRGP